MHAREIDDPLFESASANALGTVSAGPQLKRVQALALSDSLGAREAFGLIEHALAETATREQNWRWLIEHFPGVLRKIPDQWRRRTPALAGEFCEAEAAQRLRVPFARYGDEAPGHGRSLAQTEERIALCAALREPVLDWLESL